MHKPARSSIVTALVPLAFIVAACTQSGSQTSRDAAASLANPVAPGAASAAKNTDQRVLSATIDFGRDDLGSPFPPPSGHDASGHSRDSLFPREVVIDKGGTVTFVMGVSGVHEVAIYEPGTKPGDINATLLDPPAPTCPPVPTINDPNNRIAIVSDQLCEGGSPAPTWTFTAPGRYLVICTFLPHFEVGMYGWVTVRDR
jgi:plastocyanin